MSIQKDLSELVRHGLISDDQHKGILDFYLTKEGQNKNRLTLIFAAIGAIFIGLAIILVLAHNWDDLTKMSKIVIAFVPLIVSQILCGYTILRKYGDILWRETSAILLFFAIGTCMAMISQIYHIADSGGSFFLTWIALCIPIIYVMKSSAASLLCILGITYYNLAYGFRQQETLNDFYYYLYMLTILPYYISLVKTQPHANYTFLHHWLVAISVIISTPVIIHQESYVVVLTYMTMLTLFYNLGTSHLFIKVPTWANAYRILGALGIIILLLISSFYTFWYEIIKDFGIEKTIFSKEFLLAIIYGFGAIYFYLKYQKFKFVHFIDFYLGMIVFTFIFSINGYYPYIWVNLLALAIGVVTIVGSIREEKLGMLNFGLLIIALLIICRFFDTEMSYLIRGIVFAVLGIGFFVANYFMIKRLRENE